MGLLKFSRCLEWSEILQNKENAKERGIKQFIKVYKKFKNHVVEDFLWGDELECMLVGANNTFYLLLLSDDVRTELKNNDSMIVNPEFAGYMIETTPKEPYNYQISDLYKVEQNMIMRINNLKLALERVTFGRSIFGFPLFISVFPGLGVRNIFWDSSGPAKLCYNETRSKYFPDNAITNHPRFNSFQKNIRNRRGKCPEGYIPIMKDSKSNNQLINIDSFGLGMGCCCLHTTLQAKTYDDACYLYDQIAAISPLLLRITRASPVAQSRLLNTETRWDILSFAADCRTDEERGAKFDVSGDKQRSSPILKSRFSSIDCYISRSNRNIPEYNDIHIPIHEKSYELLIKDGVDTKMARHIASLFIRDPLLIYEEMINDSKIRDDSYLDDFLNIQTSNWRSVRIKPPENTGWRVEVRSMEIQPSAFENAAFSIFVFLLSRVIATYNLNFYIPISLVDENFRRANIFNRSPSEFKSKLGSDNQKFFYRRNILDDGPAIIAEGTIDEIFNSSKSSKGILYFIKKYLSDQPGDNSKTMKYVDFVGKRCSGELMSVSEWIRKFVINHAEYQKDSVLSENIENDLIREFKRVLERNNVDHLKNN
ncbi:Glutamate--cysteine ligase [Dictyocoela muelleri]|nr:Glutamate--cysteine ligase [Dictyocoela muelleri]KAG0441622.1 Glutamate--cysteine ligase [Dictyocoela muelleri]